MFGDTLLESSSVTRKNKRWPMATAFTAEAIVAAIIVIVPLLSTGVIPVLARQPIYTPVKPIPLDRVERVRGDHTAATGPARPATTSREVVSMNDTPNIFHFGNRVDPRDESTTPGPSFNPNIGSGHSVGDLIPDNGHGPGVRPGTRPIISVLSEAQLLKRVEPIYPHIAAVTGIQGQVKLHAIIARDGSIQSLNAISGHPLLVRAAMEAVEQWRYRPYVLNGEKVEVETFITVNFRRDAH
jgi:periplasmic protein TonB